MSLDNNLTVHQMHLVGIDELKKRSGMVLAMGILLVVLGMLALGSSILFTLASMVFIGYLMIMAGILQTAHGFMSKAWGGFFIDLLTGICYSVVGLMIIGHPGAVAVALTLMIAMLLIISGCFRVAVAISVKFPNALWIGINGAINILLGNLIIQEWPSSGMWVIGTFLGIDMIFNGWSLVMLGLAARQRTTPST